MDQVSLQEGAKDDKNERKKWKIIIGLILAFLSTTAWPFCWLYSNEQDLHVSQCLLIRSIPFVLCNFFARFFKGNQSHPISLYEITRSIAMTVVMGFICLSQFILPLSIVHLLICSRTLFTFIMDYFVNSIILSLKQVVGIIIGVVGVALVCFHQLGVKWVGAWNEGQSKFKGYVTTDPLIVTIFSIVFVAIMLLWAYAVVISKKSRSNYFERSYLEGISGIFIATLLYQLTAETPTEPDPTGLIELITNEQKQKPYKLYMGILYTGLPLLISEWAMSLSRSISENHSWIRFFSINSIIVGYLLSILRYQESTDIFMDLGVLLFVIGFYQAMFNAQNDDDCYSTSDQGESEFRYIRQNASNQKRRDIYNSENLSD